MRRFLAAIGFCCVLLIIELAFLLPSSPVSAAKTDPVSDLLSYAAPPPPNPLVKNYSKEHEIDFFLGSKVPADDAPIYDLIDYWSRQSNNFRNLQYMPEMTSVVQRRLRAEVERDPSLLKGLIDAMPDDAGTQQWVQSLLGSENGKEPDEDENQIKEWLINHSPAYSNELALRAEKIRDTGDYAENFESLLSLSTVDFEKAKPIIDRILQNGNERSTSRVAAKWAQYRHALSVGDLDADRYREELRSLVENTSLPYGVRDMAMDALVSEKEWGGRDDWYFSLYEDETLSDFGRFTGLTTLIKTSRDDRYTDRLIGLLDNKNINVRSVAARNLLPQIRLKNERVIKALLPWLADQDLYIELDGTRNSLVDALANVKIPEAVPALIALLNEKPTPSVIDRNKKKLLNIVDNNYYSANTVANVANAAIAPAGSANASVDDEDAAPPPMPANAAVNAAMAAARVAYSAGNLSKYDADQFPMRNSAINALSFQADMRAGPALRAVFPDVDEYQRETVIRAMIACKAFSPSEQAAAFEATVRRIPTDEADPVSTSFTLDNISNSNAPREARQLTAAYILTLLGNVIVRGGEVGDDTASIITNRIEYLDVSEPGISTLMRRTIIGWDNSPVTSLFIRDVAKGRADSDTIIRLLAKRKQLVNTHQGELGALGGSTLGVGLLPCLRDDVGGAAAVIKSGNGYAISALLACARLTRLEIDIEIAAQFLDSADKLQARAADSYLESVDTPQSRQILLTREPQKLRILGATTGFFPESLKTGRYVDLSNLFISVSPDSPGYVSEYADNEMLKREAVLRSDIRSEPDLQAVYSYSKYQVRLYKDRIDFREEDDNSRYYERDLSKEEFESLTNYLARSRVELLPSFPQCSGEYCTSDELVMLGRIGGRRLFYSGSKPEFFRGLDQIFENFALRRGKLKYEIESQMPGLQVVFADPAYSVESVWTGNGEIRIAVKDLAVRKQLADEIAGFKSKIDDEKPSEIANIRIRIDELIRTRKYDGYSWRLFKDGNASAISEQPDGFELIPRQSHVDLDNSDDAWKGRVGSNDYRIGADGIYKLNGSAAIKVLSGKYAGLLQTPDGRWLISSKMTDESWKVVRIALPSMKESLTEYNGYQLLKPEGYIPWRKQVLLSRGYDYENSGEDNISDEYDDVIDDPSPSELMMYDIVSGKLTEATPDSTIYYQLTYRPFQAAANASEVWVAVPDEDKNQTIVSRLNTANGTLTKVLTMPRIRFNSMSMWADTAAKKLYFVYRGDLLAAPLP